MMTYILIGIGYFFLFLITAYMISGVDIGAAEDKWIFVVLVSLLAPITFPVACICAVCSWGTHHKELADKKRIIRDEIAIAKYKAKLETQIK